MATDECEPYRHWDEIANEDPKAHWDRKLRQARANDERRRQQEARARALKHSNFAAPQKTAPSRTVETKLKLVKSSDAP